PPARGARTLDGVGPPVPFVPGPRQGRRLGWFLVKAIRRFTVRPQLPDALAALDDLAANLRWSWHQPTTELFRSIAPELWREGQDPIGLLGELAPSRIDELAADADFVARANALRDDLRRYLDEPRWYQSLGDDAPRTI